MKGFILSVLYASSISGEVTHLDEVTFKGEVSTSPYFIKFFAPWQVYHTQWNINMVA